MKKGALGLGTMIVFIAVILSVAAAATVLIVTQANLQNKVLKTGKATEGEVGTLMKITEVYGEDGSDNTIESLFFTVRLSSGSDPMRFRDSLVQLGLSDDTQGYLYNSSFSCSVASIPSADTYGVEYQKEGPKYTDGYINQGDIVKICFNSTRAIVGEEKYKITMVPAKGSVVLVEGGTPNIFPGERVVLFP